MKPIQFLLVVAALLGLCVGCGGKPEATANAVPAENNKAAAASVPTADSSTVSWNDKVQAYIKVGNRLNPTSPGRSEMYVRAREQADERVANGDFRSIRGLSSAVSKDNVEALKKTLAMPGETPALDKAARILVEASEQVRPDWEALDEYNTAKRYEDDGGAKGRELLPRYVQAVARIDAAKLDFNAALDAASKESSNRAVAEFKAEGKLLEMHTWQAMNAAGEIVDLFNDEDDAKNPALLEQADAKLAAMEADVAALRKEYAVREKRSGSLPAMERYESIADQLTQFAGAYRSFRKNPDEFEGMVRYYNWAVDALNQMAR